MLFQNPVVVLLGLAAPLTARPSSNIEVLERIATTPQGWKQVTFGNETGLVRY